MGTATTKKKKTGKKTNGTNGTEGNVLIGDPKGDKTKVKEGKRVVITAPNFQTAEFLIEGTAPYVQSKFSEKALAIMRRTQELGSVAKKGSKKAPKDFDALYKGAIHRSEEGWAGIPAGGIRAAMISASKICGFAMTRAKLTVFVEADGYDVTDGTPLVKITKGEPGPCEHAVRIQQTTDIRVRALWPVGWQASVRVRFDADQFNLSDVTNLLMRVGLQVGLGEGRPDSRSSAGMGWGLFALKG